MITKEVKSAGLPCKLAGEPPAKKNGPAGNHYANPVQVQYVGEDSDDDAPSGSGNSTEKKAKQKSSTKKKASQKGATAGPEKAATPTVQVGTVVQVEGYDCEGTVRFVGNHQEKGTPRVGVELDQAVGKSNGTVGGHKYFKCKPRHGVLVVPRKVTMVEDE